MKLYDFRTTALAVLAVFVAASHVEASTLECASVTSGGGTTNNGSVLVVGQAAVGTMSNASFTIEAGIVPCLAMQATGAPIPTVSEWGLFVLLLSIMVSGTIVFGRSRKAIA